MKFSLVFVFVLLTWLVSLDFVSAHGRLTLPVTRDQVAGAYDYQQNAPVNCPGNTCGTSFVCRDYPASNPAVTLVAGQNLPVKWTLTAAHEGDCFLYLSYDTNLPDAQKTWFKIANFYNCKGNNQQTVNAMIPSWVKSCNHCVLRWDWYALHQIEGGAVEYYSQCVDVSIQNPSGGSLGTPRFTIPGHLPSQASAYRNPFSNPTDTHVVGPALASPEGGSPQEQTTASLNPPTQQTTGSSNPPTQQTTAQSNPPVSQTTGSVQAPPNQTEIIPPPEAKTVDANDGQKVGTSYIVGYCIAAFFVVLILVGALIAFVVYRRRRRDYTFAGTQNVPTLEHGKSQSHLMSPRNLDHQISSPTLMSHVAMPSPLERSNSFPSRVSPWTVGAPVLAQYEDGRFYKATIVDIKDGNYLVQYVQYPDQEWKSQDKLRAVGI